ncbi:hypothetical protein JHK82_047152 [Glycine max]|nr:hypothetical protein JHK86_047044 [Glycine max]KAG4942970.1 hypothetical protein JHK85_047616 [Glycine max]KAG5097298.1 hypothetical protein JHK82_047152 [Glycine max]KAG5102085.1 hypothetical protein JHK84_047054 [Glycine max]
MKSQPSRTCMCSPTNHPGSFRCSMHKKPPLAAAVPSKWESSPMAAKANSLKATLLQMIKPSSHDHHKRKTFQPKPTRFSLMNNVVIAICCAKRWMSCRTLCLVAIGWGHEVDLFQFQLLSRILPCHKENFTSFTGKRVMCGKR